MVDWRIHIEEQEQPAHEPVAVVKGTRVEVGAVLALIADGWTLERIRSRFPSLTAEDVGACAAYAKEIMERDALQRFVQVGIDEANRGALVDDADVWRAVEAELGPLGPDAPDDENVGG